MEGQEGPCEGLITSETNMHEEAAKRAMANHPTYNLNERMSASDAANTSLIACDDMHAFVACAPIGRVEST